MNNNRVSYLDDIPAECGVLENILRHISSRPRSPNWQSFIAAKDLLTLFILGGPLTALSRSTFSKLVAAKDANEHSKPGWICCSTRTNRQVKVFRSILNVTDSSLHSIYLAEMPKLTGSKHSWLRSFGAHAVYITTLDLTKAKFRHDLFDQILAMTGDKLLSLRVYCEKAANVESIELRCTNLRSLCLDAYSNYSTAELWPAIGHSLEVLDMGKAWNASARMLTCIQTHCRALQSIKLYWDRFASDRVRQCASNLLSSYGAQLKFAQLCYLPQDYCLFALDACPNAAFNAYLNAKAVDAVAVLREVGPRLVSATVQSPMQGDDEEECQDFIAGSGVACSNLRELNLRHVDPEELGNFLVKTNSKITALCLSYATQSFQQPSDVSAHDVLIAVASNTRALRKFQFHGAFNIRLPNSISLRSVAMANPDLQHVELELDTSVIPDAAFMAIFLVDVVSSFVALRNLRVVTVGSSPKSEFDGVHMASVADACCRLRCRNTYVEILDVVYLS